MFPIIYSVTNERLVINAHYEKCCMLEKHTIRCCPILNDQTGNVFTSINNMNDLTFGSFAIFFRFPWSRSSTKCWCVWRKLSEKYQKNSNLLIERYIVFSVQITHCPQKTCIKQEQTGQACQKGSSQVLISRAK